MNHRRRRRHWSKEKSSNGQSNASQTSIDAPTSGQLPSGPAKAQSINHNCHARAATCCATIKPNKARRTLGQSRICGLSSINSRVNPKIHSHTEERLHKSEQPASQRSKSNRRLSCVTVAEAQMQLRAATCCLSAAAGSTSAAATSWRPLEPRS